ncbi:TraB/GumN family protein [Entomohabitans teleogrylli]|uniref:TraB/GumN family protein n=1 Tax=Entomohabitans teleogrylli TaxID=1384589 RepID=UPI00073D65F5|nr:TraB/GumN family protein [Entomohabitans teleogrylli]
MGLLRRLTSLITRLTSHYSWPAMDIALAGKQRLHLVGSIHMGTPDMAPLPAALQQKLRGASALIVEADISRGGSPFGDIPEAPPLQQRVSPAQWQQIEILAGELALPLSAIDRLPAWQVALVLQAHQASQLGLQADYGIDYQLLNAAHQAGIPVIELEGAESQIAILRELPDGGQCLLDDTLTHWHTNARLLQMMIGWWLDTPPQSGPVTLPNTFGDTLFDVLMRQRNQQWQTFLGNLPAGRYVVAVGALHLYGEGNLPTLLRR